MVLAPSGKVTQLYALCRHRCVQYCQCDLRNISILPLSPLSGCSFIWVKFGRECKYMQIQQKHPWTHACQELKKTVSKVLIQYNKYKVSLIVHSVVDKFKKMFLIVQRQGWMCRLWAAMINSLLPAG